MERRQALAVLGSSLAAIAGCLGGETGSESPAAGAAGTGAGAAALEDRQFSIFDEYGPDGATVRLARDDVAAVGGRPAIDAKPATDDMPDDDMPTILEGDREIHIAVSARRYPRGETLWEGQSEPISAFDGQERTVEVDFGTGSVSDSAGDHIHYVGAVRPGASQPTTEATESASPSRQPIVAETDRLLVDADGTLSPDPHPATLGDGSKAGFRRTAVEGAYHLEIGGEAVEWTLPVRVFKSEYASGATGWHGHDYPPYVEQARGSGLAARVSGEIQRAATVLDREPLPFAIEVVQRLPYVAEPDTPADEYIKYPAETLVDGGGDCEDSALLLASLLTGPPFGRECAIVHPPNHVGLGLAGEGYGGTFYAHEGTRYFFVETTAPGWAIGELPEAYANETALVFPV